MRVVRDDAVAEREHLQSALRPEKQHPAEVSLAAEGEGGYARPAAAEVSVGPDTAGLLRGEGVGAGTRAFGKEA